MTSGSTSTFVISITPFAADGALDEAALRLHLGRLRDAGVGAYVAGSGSGEAWTLSPDETRRVLAIAAEELKGRVPVRGMGREPHTADAMIEFGGWVEEAGLDAMQVYSLDIGHGILPLPREIERYLEDVLANVGVPAVLSTHRAVGYRIPLDVLHRVVERHEHVIGINCTFADVPYLRQLIDEFQGRLEVHVGGPEQGLAAIALGGAGYLCSEGNLAPELCVAVSDAHNRGDLAASHAAYADVLRLFSINSSFGSIRGIKAALRHFGLPGGDPRPPRLPLSEDERGEMGRAIEALRIAELG